MSNKRILIAGAYGTGNLGDEAILAGLLKDLKNRRHGSCDNGIIVFSRSPNETLLLHDVRAKRKNPFDLLTSDEVIIGGGELFQDSDNMALKYSILGLILGKRVIFYAIGVSSIRNPLGRALTKLSLNAADGIFIRDHRSKIRLKRLGIRKPINITKDPSLNLEPIPREAAHRLLELEGIKLYNYKFVAGISTQYIRNRILNYKVQRFFLDFLRSALANHTEMCIIFLPFNKHKDNLKDTDSIFGKWLQKQLNTDRFKILKNNYTPQEVMGIIGLLDIVVSTRLHPLIFALKMNVYGIGVDIFEKVKAFCTEHNFPVAKVNEVERTYRMIENLVQKKLKGEGEINEC